MKPSSQSSKKSKHWRQVRPVRFLTFVAVLSQIALVVLLVEGLEYGGAAWLSTALPYVAIFLPVGLIALIAMQFHGIDESEEETLLSGEVADLYGRQCELAEAASHQALLDWKRGET